MWITQTLSDFRNDDCDMVEKILSNTSLKVFTNASDPAAMKYLSEISGEVVARFKTLTQSITDTPAGQSAGVSQGEHEVLLKRVRAEQLARVNAHSDLAITCASPMVGFTQFMYPTIVEVPFSTTREEFDYYEDLGWPAPNGLTTLRGADIDPPPPPQPPPNPSPTEPPPAPKPVPLEGSNRRRRKPKKPDPEQQRRSAEYRERLKRTRPQ